MRKILLLFIGICCWAGNLGDIIQLARQSNMAQISKLNVDIATLKEESVKSAYMPSLNFDGGYGLNSGDKSILTPQRIIQVSANIDFLIYDGGKREASLTAKKWLKNGEILNNEDRLNFISLNVAKLYFGAVTLQAMIKSKQSQMDFLSSLEERVLKFHKAGLVTIDELEAVRAKFHLANVEKLSLEQKNSEILNNITLFTQQSIIPVANSKIDDSFYILRNPKLEALQNELYASFEDVKVTNSEKLPTIFLRNSLTGYKAHYSNDFPTLMTYESYKDRFFRKHGLKNEFMIGFKWKIFDFGKTYKDVEVKQIIATQASLNLNQKKLENEIKIKNLKDELSILKDKLEAQKLALKASESSFEAIMQKYNVGLASYTDMLQSLSQKFEILATVLLSGNDIEIKKAEILYEIGEDISKKVIDD